MGGKLSADMATSGKIRQGSIGREGIGMLMSAALAVVGASAAHAQSSSTGLIPIRVVEQPGNTSATPFYVAQAQGYFKDAGLDVSIVGIGGGGAPVAAALKRGEVDVSLEGAAEGVSDIARGVVQGKLIGELTDNTYLVMGAKGITDPKQFKGKIIGISGYNGGDQLYLEAVLGHYGIGANDVTWLPVGIPSVRLAALKAGRIDGTESSMEALPQSDSNLIVVSGDNSPVPFVSLTVFARQGFLDSNKPALQKLLAAIGKGSEATKAHPDQALVACENSGATASDCNLAINFATKTTNPYTWSSTLRLDVDAVTAMIPSVTAAIPSAKNMTTKDFVDTSVAAAGP